MSRVVVLGGCGGIGGVAARTLATGHYFDEVVVADVRESDARELAESLAAADVSFTATKVDVADSESIHRAIRGADVALNCVGPFYRFGPGTLEAVIAAGVDYVDICDDLDATVSMLGMDEAARAANVTALLGMGNSPGLANVLVRYCQDLLLDRVEAVDIMHIHGGESSEGAAVVKHRIHAMTHDVPLFIDGDFVEVRMLEDDGASFVTQTEFRDVGEYPVYPYPHPETITLPQHIPGLRRATNSGVVFPLSYFRLTMDMVRVGACTTRPIKVQGRDVSPLEFSVAHILAERPRLLAEAGVAGPAGCLKVVVAGTKDDEPHTYVFSLSSTTEGAGEGTGIPAALGAILVGRGDIHRPGVSPPEAVVPPLVMLELAGQVMPRLTAGGSDGSRSDGPRMPIHIEHVRPDGASETVDLAL